MEKSIKIPIKNTDDSKDSKDSKDSNDSNTLLFTCNSLFDVIKYLTEGYDIILYSSRYCRYRRFFKSKSTKELRFRTSIYIKVDVSLLNDGEWNYYITNEGYSECKFEELNNENIINLILINNK
jgi:hypothetical protein